MFIATDSGSMTQAVQALQIVSGFLWLLPAVYLTPRITASWRSGASRNEILSAPIGFVCWMMFGFSARWAVWPGSLGEMGTSELTAWAGLYALSCCLAVWVFYGARQTRGE